MEKKAWYHNTALEKVISRLSADEKEKKSNRTDLFLIQNVSSLLVSPPPPPTHSKLPSTLLTRPHPQDSRNSSRTTTTPTVPLFRLSLLGIVSSSHRCLFPGDFCATTTSASPASYWINFLSRGAGRGETLHHTHPSPPHPPRGEEKNEE